MNLIEPPRHRTPARGMLLHCGAETVTREELFHVPTPFGTSTWYPLAHKTILGEVETQLLGSGFEITAETHALSHAGARYFGVLSVTLPMKREQDYSWVVGIRNSHDQTYPAGLVAGTRVFVCDNLAFSGEVRISRKHTRYAMRDLQHLDSVKLFLGDETGMPGRLGKVLESHSRGILLFDEVEKAHRLIWDLFLQMLDAARITLADHRIYDLSGFYVVCTSNIGSHQLMRPTRLPFATLERAVLAELHRHFRPELIGRFDEKIVFRPLTPDTQREIALIVIGEEIERYRKMGIELTVDEETVEMLIRKGINKALGARPMKRTVRKFIGDAIREALKSNEMPSGILGVSSTNDHLEIC